MSTRLRDGKPVGISEADLQKAEEHGRLDRVKGEPLRKNMYYVAHPDGGRDAKLSRLMNKAYIKGYERR